FGDGTWVKENIDKNIVSLYIFRMNFQELSIIKHRIGKLTILNESLRKIFVGRRVFGPKIHGCLEHRNCFIQLAFSKEDNAEIIFGNVIVRGYGKRVSEQRFAIAPKGCLNPPAPT